MSEILGLHHVTALCRDAQRTLTFYRDLLGMRLVKKTVNFDDPHAYHLYFGDSVGSPGTLLTLFPYPNGAQGVQGTGQASSITLAVPPGSLNFWKDRLSSAGTHVEIVLRFDSPGLAFRDPDGLGLEVVESDLKETKPWASSGIPDNAAILGIDGVALSLEGYERTARLLHDRMSYRNGPHEGSRFRFLKPQHHIGGWVDLLCQPDAPRGRVAVGSIHHVAFRVENDQKQRMYRISLVDDQYNVSPVLDRNYFHSIYFREPGGVLLEIATDAPGFDVDEDLTTLGERLCLPAMYESRRQEIESALPSLN